MVVGMAIRNLDQLPGLALNFAEGDAAPEWVQLLPAGPSVKGRDGRGWAVSAPDRLVAAHAQRGADLPIDFEHSTQIKGAKGEPAPAVGWIKSLEARQGGEIWGRVAWNAEGAAAVTSRAYRYLSPVFRFDPKTAEIIGLVSAGLTNQPNLHLVALNAEEPEEEIPDMDKAVLEALGLKADATAADAVVAINRIQQERNTALNSANPELFVPKADHELALNRITAFEAADKIRADAEIVQAVDGAVAAGKIAPASKDYHLASCRADGGLERFRAMVAAAPQITAPAAPQTHTDADPGKAVLSEEELAVCRQLGLTPEEFATGKE